MKKDILDRIEQDFGSATAVVAVLESLEEPNRGRLSERVIRAIIFLADGDMVKLAHYVELARTDYRDLLWQAEYEEPNQRKYDFSRPFGQHRL